MLGFIQHSVGSGVSFIHSLWLVKIEEWDETALQHVGCFGWLVSIFISTSVAAVTSVLDKINPVIMKFYGMCHRFSQTSNCLLRYLHLSQR